MPSAAQPSDRGPTAQADTIRESSSLDAARAGQSTATPESSPLKEIYFDYDRADLRPDARDTLRAHADWLKANPTARVEIEGHADDRGTNEYNLALGAKRAQSAKDYLATLGVAGNRLSTISYGEELPVCKEATEACWQRNRRVRFVVTTGRPAS
ncbi:MAG TPA: peptidoglycan-associated lipoprotein Pal [Candidatus Acidoferrales bacterium]|nr:peptidoglycan-associated lipoprotein Pal [Candidatus Acidoferrales bacterium]